MSIATRTTTAPELIPAAVTLGLVFELVAMRQSFQVMTNRRMTPAATAAQQTPRMTPAAARRACFT
jgi:hypothetical protein